MSAAIKILLRQEVGYKKYIDLAKDLLEDKDSAFYFDRNAESEKDYLPKLRSLKSNISRSVSEQKLSAGLHQSMLKVFEKRLLLKHITNPEEKARWLINKICPDAPAPALFDELLKMQGDASEVIIVSAQPFESFSKIAAESTKEIQRYLNVTMNIFLQMIFELATTGRVDKPRYFSYYLPAKELAVYLWKGIADSLQRYARANPDDDRTVKLMAMGGKQPLEDQLRQLNKEGYINVYYSDQPAFGIHRVLFNAGLLKGSGGYIYLDNMNGQPVFHKMNPEQISEHNAYFTRRLKNEHGTSVSFDDVFGKPTTSKKHKMPGSAEEVKDTAMV